MIALAIASVAGLSHAGEVSLSTASPTNITVYGTLDGGYMSRSNTSGGYRAAAGASFAGKKSEFSSGIESDSRLGLKGSRALSDGLTAFFQLEAGISIDDGKTILNDGGGNGAFRRKSFVGLAGSPGTLVFGRVDGGRYGIAEKYDPFANGTVANMASTQVHGTRADNAIAYITPTWNGFSVLTAYTTQLIGQENPGNNGDGRLYAIIPSYNNGPLSATIDYEHFETKGAEKYPTKIYVAAGSYDFGVVKIHGYWEKIKTNNYSDLFAHTIGTWSALYDHQSWMIGASAPILGDKAKLRVSYVGLKDKTSLDASCTKFGIGGAYYLDKEHNTHIYSDFARISNKNNGICSITPTPSRTAIDSGGTGSPAAGYGTTGFDVGISYSF